MNIIILAGIAIAAYYLLKSQRQMVTPEGAVLPTPTEAPKITFTATTPVPISTEPVGKTRYTFNISARWSNLDPVSDIINFQIGHDLLASIHPRSTSGSQLVPITVEAVPGGQRQLVAIVKNIAGLEFVKAATYQNVSFGTWV